MKLYPSDLIVVNRLLVKKQDNFANMVGKLYKIVRKQRFMFVRSCYVFSPHFHRSFCSHQPTFSCVRKTWFETVKKHISSQDLKATMNSFSKTFPRILKKREITIFGRTIKVFWTYFIKLCKKENRRKYRAEPEKRRFESSTMSKMVRNKASLNSNEWRPIVITHRNRRQLATVIKI